MPSCSYFPEEYRTNVSKSTSIQAGVTIDLSQLNSISLDTENLASIGGGATWIEVYLYLESRGLAVAGGRNAAVGVGGLTLGGKHASELLLRVNFSLCCSWNQLLRSTGRLGL